MIILIPDTSILCRNSQTHKEFTGAIRLWLKDSFLNKSYVNREKGLKIIVNNAGIKKVTSSFGEILAHCFTLIPEIIENATYHKSEKDNRNRPEIIQVHSFKILINVHGIIYEVWMYVRQTKTEYQFYDLTSNTNIR